MEVDYNEIRPYKDSEVSHAIKRLSTHPWLITGIKKIKFKNSPKFLNHLITLGIKIYVKIKLYPIKTINDFQIKIAANSVLAPILKKTSDSLTWSGLEKLDPKKPYLFISNHRDIVLDPAVVNYILAVNNFSIGQIAFGDNLLINDFVSDLIRLNKAFIVKRNLTPKSQLKASILLSEYIHTVLFEEKSSIWIAQREGRAKDGNDRTNPALIKMLNLHFRRKKQPFHTLTETYNIVPVSISYEFDPCDVLKAKELYIKQNGEKYQKEKDEDLISMTTGITGRKGRIHVSFSEPIKDNFDSENLLVKSIDESIHLNYKLWPTNYLGYDLANNTNKYSKEYDTSLREKFMKRFLELSDSERKIAYSTYAMPVINKKGYST